jgi:hypothetical protein
VQVRCQACNSPLEIRQEDAGHQFFCPQCGEPMPVAEPGPFPSAPPPVTPPQARPTERVSGMAIASLVFGLISFGGPGWMWVFAVACGGWALSNINDRGGHVGGKYMAMVGVILGIASAARCVL